MIPDALQAAHAVRRDEKSAGHGPPCAGANSCGKDVALLMGLLEDHEELVKPLIISVVDRDAFPEPAILMDPVRVVVYSFPADFPKPESPVEFR